MTSGLPIVSALKRLRSLGSRHNSRLQPPMTPLRATAATRMRGGVTAPRAPLSPLAGDDPAERRQGGTPTRARSPSSLLRFPCSAELIPCFAEKIPCYEQKNSLLSLHILSGYNRLKPLISRPFFTKSPPSTGANPLFAASYQGKTGKSQSRKTFAGCLAGGAPRFAARSNRHRRPDRRPGVVTFEGNRLDVEVEDRADVAQDQLRQRPRLPRKLLARLILVIAVEMGVAKSVDEIADAEAALARNEMGQQRIARDVERHAEKDIGRALVELAGQLSLAHIELEQAVAGRQLHPPDVGDVPGRHDEAARVRITADFLDEPADLIVGLSVRAFPGAPLLAVDGPEIAVGVGPFIPDRNAVRLEIGDVGVASQKPDELPHDRLDMKPLGGDERKALRKIEADLPPEQRAHSRARPVGLDRAILKRVAHQIEIGAHAVL